MLNNQSSTELIRNISYQLSKVYDSNEARQISIILLSFLVSKSKVKLLAGIELDIDLDLIENSIKRLLQNEPVQYVVGKADFFGNEFYVSTHTLIPRSETEELVEHVLKELENRNSITSILEIGTGTGCISISLGLENKNSIITATDFSEKALEIAQINVKNHQSNIKLIKHDIFKDPTDILPLNVDIIISNPPYVLESEKANMNANVVNFEPHSALFVSDSDPLIFYKKIAEVGKTISNNFILFYEINSMLGKETCEMLKSLDFYNIKLIQDINNKDRFVVANYNKSLFFK